MTLGEARRKIKELKEKRKLIDEGIKACQEIILDALEEGVDLEDFYKVENTRYVAVGSNTEERKENAKKALDFFIQYGHTSYLKPDITEFVKDQIRERKIEYGSNGEIYWDGKIVDGVTVASSSFIKEIK